MKPKFLFFVVAVGLFFLSFSLALAQDPNGPDTVYVDCTPPDIFVPPGPVTVSFDIIIKTDNTGAGNDINGLAGAFLITNSNVAALPVLDTSFATTYAGNLGGFDILTAFVPSNGGAPNIFPLTYVLGAVDFGLGLLAGIHGWAHIVLTVLDTTTICIDTTHTQVVVGIDMSTSGGAGYDPVWQSACCPVDTAYVCSDSAGDANGDGKVNLGDIIFKVNYVFKGGSAPSPLCGGDDNADGKINLADIIYGVNYVFKGGPQPVISDVCCKPNLYWVVIRGKKCNFATGQCTLPGEPNDECYQSYSINGWVCFDP